MLKWHVEWREARAGCGLLVFNDLAVLIERYPVRAIRQKRYSERSVKSNFTCNDISVNELSGSFYEVIIKLA